MSSQQAVSSSGHEASEQQQADPLMFCRPLNRNSCKAPARLHRSPVFTCFKVLAELFPEIIEKPCRRKTRAPPPCRPCLALPGVVEEVHRTLKLQNKQRWRQKRVRRHKPVASPLPWPPGGLNLFPWLNRREGMEPGKVIGGGTEERKGLTRSICGKTGEEGKT
ncbi:hypothetical protein O3P69_006496 [Scylla paramamosain]|uniref:Uncharacterized protein n=1 Tax=Scylla paramamosain TaxID=85552 RepID=A0AAW0U6B7_SCYPA